MKRLFRWFFMLNKRLYKKASFVIMLMLIPVLITAFNFVAKEDSGFLHIVLAQIDTSDELSSQVIQELLNEDSIIRFSYAESEKEAINCVRNGDADEAWIFNSNLKQCVEEFCASDFDKNKTAVNVVAKEQNVFLRVANEKLSATMYKHYAKSYYINFARTNVSSLDSLSDEELSAYFDNITLNEDLFVFASVDSDSAHNSTMDTNYLTSPIRGLLSILVVICGIAAAIYYMQDEKSGTFSWVKESNRIYVAFACIMIATLNITSVVFISLLCTGLTASVLKELISFILYALCVAVFCLLIKQIFSSIRMLASIIPPLTVIMIALCPVFFDLRKLTALQLIFPPTYYVNVMYNNMYLLYMVIYTIVCFALCQLLQKLRLSRVFIKKHHTK